MSRAPKAPMQGVVTPVGSCRIATPLRLAADAYGFAYNRRRSLGFTHSSAEAVQQVRFFRGEIDPPASVWPLLSQSDQDAVSSEKHLDSDVYVVEICSAKELRIGEFVIQLNYLVRRYPMFFGDIGRRGAFWQLTEKGDQATLDAFLAAEWSADNEQRAESDFLRQISLHMATVEDLERDMRWLVERLPRVVFVTHVDALRSDGTPIRARSTLIGNVETVARRLNVPVFNPTGPMLDWGQARALEPDSSSLAHYTDDFSDRIGDLLMSHGVSDALVRAAVNRYDDEDMLMRHVATRKAQDNLTHLNQALKWALEHRPAWVGVGEQALRVAVETGHRDRAAALICDGRLDVLSPERQAGFAALCAEHNDIGLLSLVHERLPQACGALPYLTRLRIAGVEGAAARPQPNDVLQTAERLQDDGHDLAALALLLEEHPEAKAGEISSPSIIELITRLARRVSVTAPAADLSAILVMMRRTGLRPSVSKPVQSALNTAAQTEVDAARAADTVEPLATFVEALGSGADLVPDLHRQLAYQALRMRRYDIALPAALNAARLAPTDPQAPLFAMRAAAQLRQPFIARTQGEAVLRLIPDQSHKHRMEAENRLEALPSMFYNLAVKTDDPIEAVRLFQAAASGAELNERATHEGTVREKTFLAAARERLLAGDDTLLADLERARDVLVDQARVLFLMGRFLVTRARFAEAVPVWQRLVDLSPYDTRARAELDRCRAKVA